jgi:pyruvate, orthophosphate dikinase
VSDAFRLSLDEVGSTDPAVVGLRGADLGELAARGVPVPPAFTLTIAAGRRYLRSGWDADLAGALSDGLADLEKATGRRFGDLEAPLLVSLRPSAGSSLLNDLCMPVLNLGLNEEMVTSLAAQGGERVAVETWLLFIRHFATVVLGCEEGPFDAIVEAGVRFAGGDALTDDLLRLAPTRFLAEVERGAGRSLPTDPIEQLHLAVRTAFERWTVPGADVLRNRAGMAHDGSLAVTVQAMVLGHVDDRSGSGTVWSRDDATGDPAPVAGERIRTQGGDGYHGLVGGSLVDLAGQEPEHHDRLTRLAADLEAERGTVVGVDYTVESGELWVLGTRSGRGARAALRVLVDQVEAGVRTRAEALAALAPATVERALHAELAASGAPVLAVGLGASPGAASGTVVFSADAAAEKAGAGHPVILVKAETSPEDVHGMAAAAGILTTRGGLASHAAVVARGWGKPAVCGAEALVLAADHFRVGDVIVREGDAISIDGSSGQVILGSIAVAEANVPPELDVILGWADDVRAGRLGVRANADTGADAARARTFGAEGIGLCRTEHMFLGEDRLPIVREMILAGDEAGERRALRKLRRAQRSDFIDLLEAMDGLPVTVRLLDPPLHEFLPDVEELVVQEARGELDAVGEELLAAARAWGEANPMIGTRGVRLAVLKPGLYEMQVRALLDAVEARIECGGDPIVEIMIPLTVSAPELALARSWVDDVLGASPELRERADIRVGTMIETPRAALRAGELAAHADFFSFGTNDMTQLTFGFSRDDVEFRLMGAYLDRGLLAANPFESMDVDGVGELVRLGVERGRAADPSLKLGVCGEHGGDPASIAAFLAAGLDYVSCSPFRVPVARLAAAQAVLAADPG